MNAPAPPTGTPAPHPIPVVCDKCRAEGFGGAEGFADLGDLLDFEPVPRRPRADGWTPDLQRAFIAALAVTGSDRQAARAVGKAQFGVDQLRKAKGNEGFVAARERALAIAAEDKARRLAAGVHAVTAPAAHWRPPDPAWANAALRGQRTEPPPAPPALPPIDPDDPYAEELTSIRAFGEAHGREALTELEVGAEIVRKYALKLADERRCRLEGRIAEADFYIRQVTMLEVALDVVIGNGMAVLRKACLGNHGLLHIAETDFSRALDAARRRHWEACGDPPRPEYPPRHLLEQHEGCATEPLPVTWGGRPESHEDQRRRYQDQFTKDAEAQVEWEALARRDYERRREVPPLIDEEPGRAGQPASEGRQD